MAFFHQKADQRSPFSPLLEYSLSGDLGKLSNGVEKVKNYDFSRKTIVSVGNERYSSIAMASLALTKN